MKKFLGLAILLSALLIALPVTADPGALYVDDDDPTCGGNLPCYSTIQEAIDAASSSGDTIYVAAGSYYENVTINKSLNLTGAGKVNTIVDGGGIDRVFMIGNTDSSVNVTISGMKIQNGGIGDYGGGIYNYATLTLTFSTISGNSANVVGGSIYNLEGTVALNNSTVSGNSAGYYGGGIYNYDGMVELTDSTVSGNNADQRGGGIYSFEGVVELTNSTVSGNSAPSGGGIFPYLGTVKLTNSRVSDNNADVEGGGLLNYIGMVTLINSTVSGNSSGSLGGGFYNFDGTVDLTNSTVSGNSAGSHGGGFYNRASVELTNSTVSGNNASNGGGIYNLGTVELTNSIVAAQTLGADCYGYHPATSLGHNLDSDGTCNLTAAGDIPSTNPILGPLQDNDGPTETHALLPGSPAIDAGDNGACPASDQRGITRPVDGDGDGNTICDIGAFEFEVLNRPPTVDAGGLYRGDEGSSIPLGGASASDPDDDSLMYSWSVDSYLCAFDDATALSPTITCNDNDTYIATLTVSDGVNEPVSNDAIVTVDNVAPTVGDITAPTDPVEVGTPFITSASFIDPSIVDTHTAIWLWGDDSQCDTRVNTECTVTETAGAGSVSGNHTYTTPGVYTIKLTVTDDDGDSGWSVFEFVVVYDPDGGFITGGGWIDSSAEACPSFCGGATGKANFGFVSKYKKGATNPTGQTEFQFKAGNLNFHSDSYQWLVVAGPKAKFKGSGAINGKGNFGFMISAVDEKLTPSTNVDLFRIKIWDKYNGDVVVYDNQMDADDDADPTTAIGGGNIVIHKAKK